MTEYNVFILDCITDIQKVKDTMFKEYLDDNISKKEYNAIKKHCDELLFDLKHLGDVE